MAHPYAGKAMTSRDRAKSLSKAYKFGGAVGKPATANVAKYAAGGRADDDWDRDWYTKDGKKQYVKTGGKIEGKASGGRLDKFARGGRTKGKGKGGHHTKININIAPKGGADAALPLMPPPGLGGLPPGGPPPGLGGPPPGGPPGLPPGIGGPKPPGMMARGGKVKMTGGAETGQGRLDKAKAYKARG